MDQLIRKETLKPVVDGHIDFRGQRLASKYMYALLTVTTLGSFILGWAAHDIRITVYASIIGTILSALVVIPPWAIYKQHPVAWKKVDIVQTVNS